jgi:dipeptidyl aminopeptidase/acylaminoacyl peptidase
MTTSPLPPPRPASFGTWDSPITPEAIVADTVSLDQVAIDGGDIYWIEGRAREQGRCVLVRHRDGVNQDVTPAPWNVRTRVHEYGGGAYAIDRGTVLFSNFSDQALCRLVPTADASGLPDVLTTAGARRYADGVVDQRRNRLIAVCEDHADGAREAVNSLVAVGLGDAHEVITLAAGADFYACPRLSPDGSRLAWLSWNHPDMPWDGTCLWLATVGADGALGTPLLVAGGRRESIFQPSWSPAGELHFVSDRSGWWNLYRLRGGAEAPAGAVAPGIDATVEALQPMAAEFGRAQWNFGMATYGFEADGNLICSYVQDGRWHLARLDASTLTLTDFALPFHTIGDVKIGDGIAVFIGGAPDAPASIVRLDLETQTWTVLRRAVSLVVDGGCISIPEAIEFPTTHGLTAHAFFYAPRNAAFTGLPHERAPLVVISHGGPTATATATLNLSIQYWTSRGFAVVDVNYGGSTGYGRAYRERLYGQWGVVDVDDAIAAARFLVGRGDADGDRIAIRGSSAGGYTTLAALTFHDYFKAGASYYGVSDLEALARDCHKFESRYLDHLVGPYPEQMALYRLRSPIHFIDRLAVPLILFQGLDDKVVPPNQSAAMFDALNDKGLPVAYITFAGEQHGFRKADNIKRALQAELYFYSRVFGFAADDAPEVVEIKNLPKDGN